MFFFYAGVKITENILRRVTMNLQCIDNAANLAFDTNRFKLDTLLWPKVANIICDRQNTASTVKFSALFPSLTASIQCNYSQTLFSVRNTQM